ncbi:MAG: hypothetical protein ABIJ41_07205 [Candidatus Omnitrophota bacterium]
MNLYLIILTIGLGLAGWLFFQEEKAPPKDKKEPSKDPESLKILDRLGLREDPKKEGHLTIKDIKEPPPEAAAEITQIAEDNIKPEALLEDSQEQSREVALRDLQEKYERLETLFNEKSQELEKAQKALSIELKAKKDFNIVKDILEKELKEVKDRAHKLHLEVGAAQAESENHQRRIAQLEDKIISKEKEIKEKEKEIDELNKKIQEIISAKAAVADKQVEPALKEPVPQEAKPQEAKPQESKPEEKPTEAEQEQKPEPKPKEEPQAKAEEQKPEQKPEEKPQERVQELKPEEQKLEEKQEEKPKEETPKEEKPEPKPQEEAKEPQQSESQTKEEKSEEKPSGSKFKTLEELKIPRIIRQPPRER